MGKLGTAVLVAASMALGACGTQPPALLDALGSSYANSTDFAATLSCRQQFSVHPGWSGDPPAVESETQALDFAESLMGEHPDVRQAVRAGEVWLLVDEAGFAFAAMDAMGASIAGCADY